MPTPKLTFFCELEPASLAAFFQDSGVVDDLVGLDARISLALPDFSAERAAIVKQLNQAGIPVIAWLLLPRDQGYYLYLDNAPQAALRYTEFKRWTADHGLRWAGMGLDIEPDLSDLEAMPADRLPTLFNWLRRAFDTGRLRQGLAQYRDLVARIRADGYYLEAYQFPVIVDERQAGSTLVQAAMGIMDLPVDREVLMLYSSLAPNGPARLWSYGSQAGGIGVGSTGGGMDLAPKLSWDQLARDLRLAHCWTEALYVFSLEGCMQHGFLARLREFDWSEPVPAPFGEARRVDRTRSGLRSLLWTSAHPQVLLALPALFLAPRLFRRR